MHKALNNKVATIVLWAQKKQNQKKKKREREIIISNPLEMIRKTEHYKYV